MNNIYTVKKVNLTGQPSAALWESIPKAEIKYFPWDVNGYKPEAYARAFYTDTHIYINLRAYEKKIKALYLNENEPVYKDSCLEFFIKPNPEKDGRYMNFEMNSYGTLLLGLGENRNGRSKPDITNSKSLFNIKTSVEKGGADKYAGEFWNIEYSIPLSFLEKYFGKVEFIPGKKMKANFYKCGDETEFEHYGCWNLVENSEPDFHRPEFFGELVLE